MENNDKGTSAEAVKGLATLALLKANFDLGLDQIEIFLPLVLDCVASLPTEDFGIEQIQSLLLERYSFKIPTPIIKVLLNRAKHKGLVRRVGGRYFRLAEISDQIAAIADRKAEIEEGHNIIAAELVSFGQRIGISIESHEEALTLIFRYFAQNKITLLVEDFKEFGAFIKKELKNLNAKEIVCIARFILEKCIPDQKLGKILRQMLEGFVLQDALSLKDISTVSKKFDKITIFFDTGFIFEVLGLNGEIAALPAREGLDLLRATKASLSIFDVTVEEVKRILWVHEKYLSDPRGIVNLRQNPFTRYIIKHRLTSSDIREITATLEKQLFGLGISIKNIPKHEAFYTLDEEALSKKIAKSDETELDPRVRHDVDCIAGVLTLRKGHTSDSLENVGAIFATGTGLLVKNTREWYRGQGKGGLSPVIHHINLSGLAWLKNPNFAPDLKLHELVALCSSALMPSRRLWEHFIQTLRKLYDSNRITSDEIASIIASELTESLLLEYESDSEPDAASLTEVIDRVKASYREEADIQIRKIKAESTQEIAVVLSEQKKTEKLLHKGEEEHRKLIIKLRADANSKAKKISYVLFIIAAIMMIFAPGLILLLKPLKIFLSQILIYIITGIVWLLTNVRMLFGGHLNKWRKMIEVYIEQYFLKKWGLS